MSSKNLKGDVNYAWPTGQVAVMGAEGAVNIVYRDQIRMDAEPDAKRAELIEEYERMFMNPYVAASRGLIDDVIDPPPIPGQRLCMPSKCSKTSEKPCPPRSMGASPCDRPFRQADVRRNGRRPGVPSTRRPAVSALDKNTAL